MNPIERLINRLDETKSRFDQRSEKRHTATERLSRGDYVGANENATLKARLSQLGMNRELTRALALVHFKYQNIPMPIAPSARRQCYLGADSRQKTI